jgi:phosphate transport system substrate-binding protein
LRPEDFDSQATPWKEIMQGEPVRKPMRKTTNISPWKLLQPIWETLEEMDAPLGEIIDYRNLENAIGSSFRFYAQEMYSAPDIRLLSIDGIEPTPKNIRTRRYPLTVDVYMVTARPLSDNAQKLHDWFLGPEGQQFIEDVGCIPIAPTQ